MNAGDNIGIMDAAFFVSKNELLTWLNTVFQVSGTPLIVCVVEHSESGAVRHRGRLLPGFGRDLPGHSENEPGQLAGQERLRVRLQLQDILDRPPKSRHHPLHRRKANTRLIFVAYQADESEIPG
jgi:hypothetical protein